MMIETESEVSGVVSPASVTKGRITQDYDYPKRLAKAIVNDKSHPFNNGVHMAAHHLLSAKAAKETKLGNLLIARGYDINVLENLVFLPCTLSGACQLSVQLHRGNHTFHLPGERPYHEQVTKLIQELKADITECDPNKIDQRKQLQKDMDKKSAHILERIAEFKVPLTSIFRNFEKMSKVGCSNQQYIPACVGSVALCDHKREHINQIDYLYHDKRKYPQQIVTRKLSHKLSIKR